MRKITDITIILEPTKNNEFNESPVSLVRMNKVWSVREDSITMRGLNSSEIKIAFEMTNLINLYNSTIAGNKDA